MEILQLFGVDWKLLVAQLVNFTVVVLVLWFFALKPLTRTMQKRSDEIQKGLSDAELAAEKLTKVEEDVKAKLMEAKSEAAKILEAARLQAEESRKAGIVKTKSEIEELIKKAKTQIAGEKDNMVSEIKSEVADMIVIALEKILSGGLSREMDKKYIEKVLKEIK
ncbi:F0F1 ATP synthase subunit B [Patescibacteria group bacterium]|nr:F0F1 ATP synthase subunit B [Patescibacteria group bacterium]